MDWRSASLLQQPKVSRSTIYIFEISVLFLRPCQTRVKSVPLKNIYLWIKFTFLYFTLHKQLCNLWKVCVKTWLIDFEDGLSGSIKGIFRAAGFVFFDFILWPTLGPLPFTNGKLVIYKRQWSKLSYYDFEASLR